MKKTFLLIALSALFVLVDGCRREDFREHTFEIPGMTSENIDTIKNAIYVYGGVVRNSLEFNLENKTLKVRFDSMKVAQTNIRMAIEEKGVEQITEIHFVKSGGVNITTDKEVGAPEIKERV